MFYGIDLHTDSFKTSILGENTEKIKFKNRCIYSISKYAHRRRLYGC